MDVYSGCLDALTEISRALEKCVSAEAKSEARVALAIAQDLALQLERQFQDSESRREFVETVISSIADAVLVADAGRHISLLNDAARELFSWTREEELFVGGYDVRFPDGRRAAVREMPLGRALRGERFSGYEIVLLSPDGRRRYLKTSGAPVRDPDGKITGAVVVMHDLTREHDASEELDRQRRRLEQILDTMPEGVLVVEGDSAEVKMINSAARRMIGDVPIGFSMLSERIRGVIRTLEGHPLDVDEYPVIKSLRQGISLEDQQLRTTCPEGKAAHVITDTAPLRDQESRVYGAVAVFRDISSMRAEHERLQQSYEREHHLVETLQRSLLPPESVQVEGYEIAATYRPAMESERVGGDFYDSFKLPDGRAVLCIGDVSGKGVEAAVFTSLTRDCIRAHILDTPNPAAVLKKLNRTLYTYLPEDYFVTVFLALLSPGTGQVTFASAGHDPPLIYRAKKGSAAELRIPGRLSGIFPELSYTQRTISLRQGDALFFYTDGLAEARREGEVLGTEGLAELLAHAVGKSSKEAIDYIYSGAVEFAGGSLHDDAAAILVKAL